MLSKPSLILSLLTMKIFKDDGNLLANVTFPHKTLKLVRFNVWVTAGTSNSWCHWYKALLRFLFFDLSVVFTCSKVINASSDRIRGPIRFGEGLNLTFPNRSSQNMRGFDHASILIPVSTDSARNAWHNNPVLCPNYEEKRVADYEPCDEHAVYFRRSLKWRAM